jgi:hypothetical protein
MTVKIGVNKAEAIVIFGDNEAIKSAKLVLARLSK